MENIHNHNIKSIKEIELELEALGIPKEENFASEEFSERADMPYVSQKELILNEVLNSMAEENDDLDEKPEKTGGEKKSDVSRLNPESEILTEKDPDEVIILPNEEQRKINIKKNRNQPL